MGSDNWDEYLERSKPYHVIIQDCLEKMKTLSQIKVSGSIEILRRCKITELEERKKDASRNSRYELDKYMAKEEKEKAYERIDLTNYIRNM